jgi:Fibronectin type III domain
MSDTGRDDLVEPNLAELNLVEPDLVNKPERGGRGTIITLATVIALLLATGLTVLGIGAANNAVANFDASSWLWSSAKSEVDRVNGVTGRVDTRTKIKDSQNHDIQVTQTDKHLILRDLQTGETSALDLTTLQISAVMGTTPGLGVNVALHGEQAFVVDSVQGQVRQLDPRSLAPTGDAIVLPNGIEPGGFDGKGSLWVAVPTEGTVVAILPGKNGASPKVLRTVTVTQPGHDLVLSALDEGLAVLDNTEQTLSTIVGDVVEKTAVPINGPAAMPARTGGPSVPITVSEDRKVVVVDGKKVRELTVPGSGPLSPAVTFAGHVYCADAQAGTVYEFDGDGKRVNEIRIASSGGALELEVRENHLFINAPDGSTARVVNEKHVVKEVNKYEQGVLGGEPPPPPPTQEPKPTKTVPGKPQNVTATGGDSSAVIAWRKAADNGSPITKYVVEGAGQSVTVGARQRSVQIKGLTNGQTYRFTVYAVNGVGAGPKAQSPPVTALADVPSAPTSVTATAKPDGTVDVTWPAANGLGRKIVSYNVTSISGGAQAPVGSVPGTTMTIAKGSLAYGTQYAFTVVAVNDRNAGSVASPASNTVVPFTVPGAPRSLTAGPAPNQRGAILVSWQPAPANGRPVTKYVVDAGTGPRDVTGTTATLSGFPDDTAVQVKVHAVNEAGNGPDGIASGRTIGVPTLTVTGNGAGYNSVSVTLTPNNKGGAAVCRLQINGGGTAQVNCTTQPVTITVNGLWPNNTYGYTVSVTTAAGSASATGTRATNQLRFTVICPNNVGGYCNSGIWAYRTPNQQQVMAVNPSLPVGATGTPQCYTTGQNVDARPWGAKNSNQWLRFSYSGGNNYFPFAWARLDGGDNLGMIPAC